MDSYLEFAFRDSAAWMRVVGRATYALSPRLADFIGTCLNGTPERLHIDLQKCVSMDSTFIGILTKNVIRSNEGHLDIELLNTPPHIKEQIRGLGLARYFNFDTGETPDTTWNLLQHIAADNVRPKDRLKETMLEAHESLGEAAPENVTRFKNVIAALKKEA